jgi:hypothetical protein
MTKRNIVIVLIIIATAITIGVSLHRNYTLESEEYKALKKFENILSNFEKEVENIKQDSIKSIEE